MSTTYRVLLVDDFNWDYVGFDRKSITESINNIIPHAEIEADLPRLIIFYVGKTYPDVLIGNTTYDQLYVQDDNTYEIKKID